MTARLLPTRGARRACAGLCGIAGLGLVLAGAFLGGRPDQAPAAPIEAMGTAGAARPAPAAVSSTALPDSGSGDETPDEAAIAYYRSHGRTVAVHVQQVLWTPPLLRVYTDLPASAANSRTALNLCGIGAAYLEGRGRIPIVFVHARTRDGYPVLANKTGPDDTCRLGAVP